MRREFLFASLPPGGAGAEIGVHLGDFARRLLDRARPRRLYLIDPWRHRPEAPFAAAWFGGRAAGQAELDARFEAVRARFQPEIDGGQVTIDRRPSTEALADLADDALDWIYIDGDHRYDAARADLALALRKVRPGGVIAGDDYGVAGWWDDGVTRAVDELAASEAVETVVLRNGQYVLRRGGAADVAAATLYFHPDMIGTDGQGPIGRRVAGRSFLSGFLRHGGAPRPGVAAETPAHLRLFEETARALGHDGPVDGVLASAADDIAKRGVLVMPGPCLAQPAWVRRRAGDAAYSIAGVAHTVASARVMDCLFESLTAPVQDWDAIVCPSAAVRRVIETQLDAAAAHLTDRFGATRSPRPQLPVIPLGVDAAAFADDPQERAEWRELYAPSPDAVVVMTMARFSIFEKMHIAPLLIALEQAAVQASRPVAFWLVGWFANAHDERLFRANVAAFAPSVHIRLLDGRDAGVQRTIWSGADVFALPVDNIQETFGLAPVEAMAAGLPVVASDWNGLAETVQHGVTGFLAPTTMAPPGDGRDLAERHFDGRAAYLGYLAEAQQRTVVDVAALRDAFVHLIDDADLRARMGAAGRERAASIYDWAQVIPQYLALWEELADRRTRTAAPETANPRALDPFRLYRDYATRPLGDDDRLTPVTSAAAANVAQLMRTTGAVGFDEAVAAAAIAALLAYDGEAPLTPRLAADAMGLDLPAARRLVLWAAKFGLLGIAPASGGRT